MAATWVNQPIADEDFAVDIFSDFSITTRGAEDLDRIIKMREGRHITHETMLKEVKRRGTLSEAFDVDEEIEALEAEKLELAEQGLNPLTGEPVEREPDDDDDEDLDDEGQGKGRQQLRIAK